ELVAIVAVALTVTTVTKDGEATWFEGVLLLAVYLLLALAFYFVTPVAPPEGTAAVSGFLRLVPSAEAT
ncbi:MAG: calcium/proton exchanger, partial [Deinococcota bacterium]